MKKVFSLLLAVAFVLVAFAGCGGDTSSGSGGAAGSSSSGAASGDGSDSQPEEVAAGYPTEIDMEEEPYTVAIQVVTLPGTQFEGKEDREAAINAITVPAINCKVEIQEVWISEIADTTSMAVAGGEKVDLIHVATVNSLSSLVGSDILFDMNTDNLLQNRGKELVNIFGELLGAGNVNGQQLAVPANVFNALGKGIYYNKELADKYEIVIPDKITFDELDGILSEFKAAAPDVMPFFMGGGELNYQYWLEEYEVFGNQASYGVILDPGKELKVENLYTSEMFKDYCLRTYNWKQNGIITGDPTDSNPAQSYFDAGQLFAVVSAITPQTKADAEAAASFELGWAETVAPSITNSAITEYMWGIASNCQRPDKAMDFLNFLYSNADVANILVYGIEGVNYDFVEGSDNIVAINGSYLPLFYRGGNTEDMYIKFPAGNDYITQFKTLEETAVVSPVCYYMFNDSDFQTESAVIYSTILEYLPRLQNGMAESEEATLALIDELNAKLTASGIDDVIAANQAQLDQWLATQ